MILSPFTKTYEQVTVLDFPGIQIEPGRIYGVIGANGSGKSTFAKILSGILKADHGTFPFGYQKLSVGYMPQKNYAFRMSTRKNILLTGSDENRANTLMDALQIRHLENKSANKLSGGETARMALARLMMSSYDIVILDEPTAAMDMETTILAEQLITKYVRDTGCSLILITYSLSQASRLADELLFFYKGKLMEQGPAKTLLETPVQKETKQFLDFYGI